MLNEKKVFSILGSSNHSLKEREENDFYATDPKAVSSLIKKLDDYNIVLPDTIIEPAVGTGNIAKPFKEIGKTIIPYDIVDRGYPGTIVNDFLKVDNLQDNKCIITNPPYKYAKDFVEHSLDLINDGEYLINLLKIQFLEGKARRELFAKYPPKYVWVFSERIGCYKNNEPLENSSAICYCWYIWQKGFSGRPEIDWI